MSQGGCQHNVGNGSTQHTSDCFSTERSQPPAFPVPNVNSANGIHTSNADIFVTIYCLFVRPCVDVRCHLKVSTTTGKTPEQTVISNAMIRFEILPIHQRHLLSHITGKYFAILSATENCFLTLKQQYQIDLKINRRLRNNMFIHGYEFLQNQILTCWQKI